MDSILILTKLFFQNIIRDKFFTFLIVIGFLFGLFSILLNEISYGATELVVRSFSLGFLSLTMNFLGIFFGVNIISSENMKNSIILLICKPIRKYEIIISAVLAFLVSVLIAVIIIFLEFYFIFNLYGLSIGIQISFGIIGIVFECMTLFILSMLLRNFLSPLITIVFIVSTYIFSHSVKGLLELNFIQGRNGLKAVISFFQSFLPDLTYFDFKHLVYHTNEYTTHVANGSLYFTVSFSFLVLFVSYIFSKRDFE